MCSKSFICVTGSSSKISQLHVQHYQGRRTKVYGALDINTAYPKACELGMHRIASVLDEAETPTGAIMCYECGAVGDDPEGET